VAKVGSLLWRSRHCSFDCSWDFQGLILHGDFMTFLEVCQQVIGKTNNGLDFDSKHGIWRMSWPQDIILGFNEKKDAYASFPAVSVSVDADNIVSKAIVFSFTRTEQLSYIGWLPSVDDLLAVDWETNITQE
jgi:hypothetical protein